MADSNPALYFGRQVRRARVGAGWSLIEFGQRIGYDRGQISRIENGKRTPTETFARMCDQAFPDRDGWFTDFYMESRGWLATPPWFRSWGPHEQKAGTLRVWTPGIVHGLLQTEAYASAVVAADPGTTESVVIERTAARMQRQHKVLMRDDPPTAWFLVDVAALRRLTGSPAVMAEQLRHLVGVARLPHVTVQAVPAIAHAGLSGGFVVADVAAYAESVVSGHVFEDAETVTALIRRFDTIRSEALRASDSFALFERMAEQWLATGGSQPFPGVTGEIA